MRGLVIVVAFGCAGAPPGPGAAGPGPEETLLAELRGADPAAALANPENLALAIERRDEFPELFERFARAQLHYTGDLRVDRQRLRAFAGKAGFASASSLVGELNGVDLAEANQQATAFIQTSESLYRATLQTVPSGEDDGLLAQLIRMRESACRVRFEYAWLRSADDAPETLYQEHVSAALGDAPSLTEFASKENRWGQAATHLASTGQAGHVASDELLRQIATRLATH